MSYVYIRSEPQLWTVGFYTPDGAWETESNHDSKEEAAERVHWLNGGKASKKKQTVRGSIPCPRQNKRKGAEQHN